MSPHPPLTEVRRFLHCNYNCVDLAGLERWYTELFALKPVMRTGEASSDGWPFGLQMLTASSTVFLYDQRGARVATSLELVRWTSPPTCGAAYADPWMLGLQSFGHRVPDVEEVVRKATELGGAVVRRTGTAALLRDPEGAVRSTSPSTAPSEASGSAVSARRVAGKASRSPPHQGRRHHRLSAPWRQHLTTQRPSRTEPPQPRASSTLTPR